MPRGVFVRKPKPPPPWARPHIRGVPGAELLAAYRAQVTELRAAADPGVTDRRRGLLAKRVVALRMELRRRDLLPSSPREAACRGD